VSSSLRASRQPMTRWPSTMQAGWSDRLPVCWGRVSGSRALLPSMLMMASHGSLTTASAAARPTGHGMAPPRRPTQPPQPRRSCDSCRSLSPGRGGSRLAVVRAHHRQADRTSLGALPARASQWSPLPHLIKPVICSFRSSWNGCLAVSLKEKPVVLSSATDVNLLVN
jgi:hypothetical protein